MHVVLAIKLVLASDSKNYNCFDVLCVPKDYKITKTPSAIKVYTRFWSPQKALKNVDDEKMVISIEPAVGLIWKDPRLTLAGDLEKFKLLPDSTLNEVWYPRITVQNRAKRKDSHLDLGKIGTFQIML